MVEELTTQVKQLSTQLESQRKIMEKLTGHFIRKNKDPNAPKRPHTAYICYNDVHQKDVSEEMTRANGGVRPKQTDIMRELSRRWNEVAKTPEAQRYHDMAAALRQEYDEQMKVYKSSAPLVDEVEKEVKKQRSRSKKAAAAASETEQSEVSEAGSVLETPVSVVSVATSVATTVATEPDPVVAPTSSKKGKARVAPAPVVQDSETATRSVLAEAPKASVAAEKVVEKVEKPKEHGKKKKVQA